MATGLKDPTLEPPAMAREPDHGGNKPSKSYEAQCAQTSARTATHNAKIYDPAHTIEPDSQMDSSSDADPKEAQTNSNLTMAQHSLDEPRVLTSNAEDGDEPKAKNQMNELRVQQAEQPSDPLFPNARGLNSSHHANPSECPKGRMISFFNDFNDREDRERQRNKLEMRAFLHKLNLVLDEARNSKNDLIRSKASDTAAHLKSTIVMKFTGTVAAVASPVATAEKTTTDASQSPTAAPLPPKAPLSYSQALKNGKDGRKKQTDKSSGKPRNTVSAVKPI